LETAIWNHCKCGHRHNTNLWLPSRCPKFQSHSTGETGVEHHKGHDRGINVACWNPRYRTQTRHPNCEHSALCHQWHRDGGYTRHRSLSRTCIHTHPSTAEHKHSLQNVTVFQGILGCSQTTICDWNRDSQMKFVSPRYLYVCLFHLMCCQ